VLWWVLYWCLLAVWVGGLVGVRLGDGLGLREMGGDLGLCIGDQRSRDLASRPADATPTKPPPPPSPTHSQMSARDPAHYAILVLSHTLNANLAGQQLVKLMESM